MLRFFPPAVGDQYAFSMIELGFAFMIGSVLLVANRTLKSAAKVPALRSSRCSSSKQKSRRHRANIQASHVTDVDGKVRHGTPRHAPDSPIVGEFSEKSGCSA